MNTPAVSIIITCYNYGKYLPERLRSIYSQTFQDCEVIFIDDRSTDNSVEIFEKWEPKTFPTRGIYNTINEGNPYPHWKKGLDEAKGEFIWMADADDFAEPTLVETCVNLLRKNPEAALAFVQSIVVDEKGKPLGVFPRVAQYKNPELWDRDFTHSSPEEWEPHMLLNNTVPNPSGAVFRKSHFPNYARILPDYHIIGDWAAWLDLLRHGSLAYSATPLNYYRCHTGSICRSPQNVRRSYFEQTHMTNGYLSEWEVPTKIKRQIFYELIEFWYYSFWVTRQAGTSVLDIFRAYLSAIQSTHLNPCWIVCETSRWVFHKIANRLNKSPSPSPK